MSEAASSATLDLVELTVEQVQRAFAGRLDDV